MTSQQSYIYVCTGCGKKEKDIGVKSQGRGEVLLQKLGAALDKDEDILVLESSCLSNCKRGISVALTSKNKYHWLFGEKDESDESVSALIRAAKAYHNLTDGFLEKPDRAKPVIAHIPPIN